MWTKGCCCCPILGCLTMLLLPLRHLSHHQVAAQDGRFQILRCDKGGGAGGEEKAETKKAEGSTAAKLGGGKEKKSKKPKKSQ